MEPQENKRVIKARFGRTVEISDRNVIRIDEGLMGFEGYEHFAILPHGEESPLFWLQSLDEPELAFVTIDPRIFIPGYEPDVAGDDLERLGLESVSRAVLLCIVVIPEDPQFMTANLQGPLIINSESRTGRQVISRSPRHRVRHYLLGNDGNPPEKK